MSVKRTLKISLFALALSSVCSLSTAFADDAIPDPFAAVKAQNSTAPAANQAQGVAPAPIVVPEPPQFEAQSWVLMDYYSGRVICEQNSHEKIWPASLTKMMTAYVIGMELKAGRLHMDDDVTITEDAWAKKYTDSSKMFIEVGRTIKVGDLVRGIIIQSGNDACVAMAIHLAGTQEGFVSVMNNYAAQLGLKDTHFSNVHGLFDEMNYSSAYDMSIMARELVRHEKILEFSSIYEDYLRKNTAKKFWLVNTNKLVKFYSYIDGLKTGYTGNAGYCLTATGMKNDMRLISVVMGEQNTDNRTTDTLAMLDYGFNMYSINKVVNKDKSLGNVRVNLGDIENVDIMLEEDITILNNNQKGKKNITYEINTNNINAPVKKGDVVGKIDVYEEGRYLYSRDITVMNDIEKANIFKVFIRNLRDIVGVKV